MDPLSGVHKLIKRVCWCLRQRGRVQSQRSASKILSCTYLWWFTSLKVLISLSKMFSALSKLKPVGYNLMLSTLVQQSGYFPTHGRGSHTDSCCYPITSRWQREYLCRRLDSHFSLLWAPGHNIWIHRSSQTAGIILVVTLLSSTKEIWETSMR